MPSEKILIVEDERPFAEIVEGLLRRLGYEVVGIADSGEAALELAETTRPGLALIDIEILGSMDGFDVAERLRQKYDLPVIFLTGRGDDATLERVRRSESFGYLLKPFRHEELKAVVELAFGHHGHEARLKAIELAFSAAFKSIEDAVVLVSNEGSVNFINPAAERLCGWSASRAVGQQLSAVIKLQPSADGGVQAILRAAACGAFVHETVLLNSAGHEVPIEVSAAVVRDEVHGNTGSVLVFREVTARKQYEAGLRKSQAELRSLAGHLESAREAERTRIAREIHDELGQLLTGFKMDLTWLEKKLAARPEISREILQEKVRSMTGLLGEMVLSVRRIATELRPGILDDLGLAAAVEWQTNDFQHRTGIRTQVATDAKEPVASREVATAIFRVLQESLTNVARHAEARNVWVKLGVEAGKLLLEVSDDGRGISEAELRKAGAFGLMGMRERILPLRGQCEIHGTPGKGTTVRVSVPSAPQKEEPK